SPRLRVTAKPPRPTHARLIAYPLTMDVKDSSIETLVDSVRKVSSSLDLDEVIDTIFEAVKELIDYSAAVICVLDTRTGTVLELKTMGYPPQFFKDDFLNSGSGIIGWVIKNCRGTIVNDVKTDSRYVKARSETRSEIAAPITRADGQCIGAINLEYDSPSFYDEHSLELLTMFASLASAAIDHTLLYRQGLEQRPVEDGLS